MSRSTSAGSCRGRHHLLPQRAHGVCWWSLAASHLALHAGVAAAQLARQARRAAIVLTGGRLAALPARIGAAARPATGHLARIAARAVAVHVAHAHPVAVAAEIRPVGASATHIERLWAFWATPRGTGPCGGAAARLGGIDRRNAGLAFLAALGAAGLLPRATLPCLEIARLARRAAFVAAEAQVVTAPRWIHRGGAPLSGRTTLAVAGFEAGTAARRVG